MGKDYSIFDNMLEGCQIISHDWRYLYVNDAAVQQNRVKKENLLGKTVMEVYPGIEKTELFSNLQKSMKERISVSMENEFTFPDNHKTWFETRIEPIQEGIFILSLDINKRKKAEEKNRMIIESMAENYLELDNEWHYKDINERIEKAMGKKKEELIGKHPYDVFPVLRGSKLCEKLKEAKEKNKTLTFEAKIPISGQCVELYTYPSDEGITVYSHDITERKQVEKAIIESEERYHSLFKDNHAVMFLIDPDNGDIVDANPAACFFYGYSKDELLKMKITDLNMLTDENVFKEMQKARSEKKNHFIFKHRLASGDIRDVDVYSGSITVDGRVLLYSIVHDITKQIEAEKELKRHDKVLEGINMVLHGSLILETEEEVAGKCLEVAKDLTGSEFGFLGEIGHDRYLNTLAISPLAWKAFKISSKKRELVKKMEIVSYWGRTIKEEKSQIVNDPESDPDKRGFPEGHPKVTSFLGVPLKQRNTTIGMIALANKDGGYTEEDVGNVEALSVAFVESLMRKRAEIQLKESHDILEEKVEERTAELEEAYSSLKESEEKFRGIFDNAPDMISLIEGDEVGTSARYIEVNEVGIKRLGYSREEFLNMSPADIDGGSETLKYIEKLLKESHIRFETIHVAKDGSKIPVDVIIHFIEYKGRKVALEIARDISEHKKAEIKINQYKDQLENLVKELRESRAHFKSLSENSPDLIIRVDKELNYLYTNPVILEFTGQSPEYFTGKNIEEIAVPKEYISLWKEEYQKTFETGKIQYMEFEFHTVSGLKFFERITVPEFNDKGEIETALSISRDITERKEVEKKLEETVGDLKRSNDELQRFAYVASHDLQEPLRTISSFTQLLERRYSGKLDSDADEFIEYVVEAAQRMQQMIHDLLEYSRIMVKGKEFEEVNTEKLLKEVISSLKTIIDENNALVTYNHLPVIIADESQIRRVFQNLIVNAVKFQKPDEPPRIHISCRKDEKNKEYVFSVTDNGIGIEKQYFDRIFTIFQRLHTLDEYRGTGIGLSIVQRIVERHGGRIWVESEHGVGSTFYFTILFDH